MPQLPLVCKTCSKAFPGVSIGAGGQANIRGTLRARCPFCGGEAETPRGVYKALEDSFQFISQQSIEELRFLKEVLEATQEKTLPPEESMKEIAEAAPWFKKFLPKNPQDLAAYIGIVIALVAIMIVRKPDNLTPSEIDRYKEEATINYYIGAGSMTPPSVADRETARNKRKKRNNSPCPCGSGKNYKKCCGKRG